jgi:hypothetical protein
MTIEEQIDFNSVDGVESSELSAAARWRGLATSQQVIPGPKRRDTKKCV